MSSANASNHFPASEGFVEKILMVCQFVVGYLVATNMTFQSSKGRVTYLTTLNMSLKVIIRTTILKILAPETMSTCLQTLASMVGIPL